MDANTTNIVIAIVIIAVAIGVIALMARAVRSRRLRGRYGAEYQHAVETAGGRHKAEEELREREKRVHAYALTPLTSDDRARFSSSWHDVEAAFVSNPSGAVARADELLTNVMAVRGYPMADFDQRAADLSVDHAEVVTNYRAGHDRRPRIAGRAFLASRRRNHEMVGLEDLIGQA